MARRGADADPLDELLRDAGAGGDPHRHRQEREARLERRVAEDLLHVERAEEEEREQAADREQQDQVRAGERAHPEDPEPDQRRLGAALDEHERDQEHGRDGEEGERLRGAPAVVLRLDDRVDEHDEARGDADRAGQVDAVGAVRRARLRHVADRQRRGGEADRHVDEEDPLPAQQVGEDAAEQQAEGAAAGRDRAPDAERLRALLALREGGGDDRERGGGDERAAEALERPGADEPALRRREPVEQRGGREDRDAREEQPAPAEQVARAAAEQQEAAEHERVGVDDPLEVGGAEPEVGLDRRQRDVDHRRVEHDHELGEADDDEDDPAVALDIARTRGLDELVLGLCGGGRHGTSQATNRYTSALHCGCGEIGIHAAFRSPWGQPRGGSSPLSRTAVATLRSGPCRYRLGD